MSEFYPQRIGSIMEKTCVMCGKPCFPTPDWVYKSNHKVCCSYHCYLRLTATLPARRRRANGY